MRGVQRVRRLRDLAGLRRQPTTSWSRYLSPFYSPCLGDCVAGSSDFGQPFGWFPLSAALIILIFPLGFRLTCYYYRKAYYRSFWLSAPACGVAEPHGAYSGESRLPLILNNIHRLFGYAAVVVALILSYDTLLAFGPMEGETDGIHMVARRPPTSSTSRSSATRCRATCCHAVGRLAETISKYLVLDYKLVGLVLEAELRREVRRASAVLVVIAYLNVYLLDLERSKIAGLRRWPALNRPATR